MPAGVDLESSSCERRIELRRGDEQLVREVGHAAVLGVDTADLPFGLALNAEFPDVRWGKIARKDRRINDRVYVLVESSIRHQPCGVGFDKGRPRWWIY